MQVCRIVFFIVICVLISRFTPTFAQSLGGAGTVEGVVTDPSGAAISNAQVELSNAISGYKRQTTTDATGTFRFSNLPPNPYRVQVTVSGFAPFSQDVAVRTAVPISLKVPLALAGNGQQFWWRPRANICSKTCRMPITILIAPHSPNCRRSLLDLRSVMRSF